MSEPPRFLSDPSASEFERGLLESWATEQPSSAARGRALAIAGVAAAGTLAAASAGTAVAAGTASAGTASANLTAGAGAAAAPKAAALGMAAATKWGIVGLMVVASVVAGVVVVQSRTSETMPSPAAAETNATPTTPPTPLAKAAPSLPNAAEPPTLSPADLPTATAALPAPTVTATAAAPATAAPVAAAHGRAPADSSLIEEIASFDRARAALDAGDADRALTLLDAYEQRFPGGTFVQEAEVLRVQALARKGDDAGARRVGQRFLAAHPTSPHAARIRAILDASNP